MNRTMKILTAIALFFSLNQFSWAHDAQQTQINNIQNQLNETDNAVTELQNQVNNLEDAERITGLVTVTVSTDLSEALPGESIVMTWSSANATACFLDVDFAFWEFVLWDERHLETNGSITLTVESEPEEGYTSPGVDCKNDGYGESGASAQVTVTVPPPPPEEPVPAVNVLSLGGTNVLWGTSDVDTCTPSSSPANSVWDSQDTTPLSGVIDVAPLSETTVLTMTCLNNELNEQVSHSLTLTVE